MANKHRWNFSVLAAAAVLSSAGLYTNDALALALGRVTVQSALGEPLRADIELPEITPEEAASLRVATGSAELFRSQGMELSPALNGVRITLQRRPDGRSVLRLAGDRPINEPFVDLVIDASWNSGRVVRNYTMLFDPPTLRSPAPTVTAPAQIAPPPAAAPAGTTPVPTPAPATVASPTAPAAAPTAAQAPQRPVATTAKPAATSPAPGPKAATAPRANVVVKRGDTAGRLASTHRPDNVSLDQMLVAMMRANPDAFIQGNVNRIKAGAVIEMPDAAEAQATSAAQARQIIAAQSRDFNSYRRQLAGQAPTMRSASSERSASGKVQARVDDAQPSTTTPDRLTLSKGSLQDAKGAEEQMARDRQAQEAATRMAELSKNINELSRLQSASNPAPASATAPAQATPASSATGPALAVASPPAIVASAPLSASSTPEAAESAAPAAPASMPAASAPAPAAPVPPPPIEEPSFVDSLLADPLVPAAGGGLLALLIGLGAYRVIKRRREAGQVDSSFLESRIPPDSFFGASGGQRVDTSSTDAPNSSSMMYSPSQLDAGGDVDPVAEADVYLAYGRDLQAEEILKEALRHNPGRVAVHVKLAEIYAKRQDRAALAATAADVRQWTQGAGPEWAHVVELGLALDPDNGLYQQDAPSPADAGTQPQTAVETATPADTSAASAAPALPPGLDLDLDLDLDLPDSPLAQPPAAPGGFAVAAAAAGAILPGEQPLGTEPEAAPPPPAPEPPDLMDARWNPPAEEDEPQPQELTDTAAPEAATVATTDGAIDFPLDDLPAVSPGAPEPTPPASASAPLEFDLGELSLELTPPPPAAEAAAAMPATAPASSTPSEPTAADAELDEDQLLAADDPLATKLALAEEFNAIGDTDGARTLIEEVVAEATGPLKARAQRMLSDLG